MNKLNGRKNVNKFKKIELLATIALFATALIWGSSFVVVKDTVEVVEPFYLLAFRFTIGAVLLSVIFWKNYRALNKQYLIQEQ